MKWNKCCQGQTGRNVSEQKVGQTEQIAKTGLEVTWLPSPTSYENTSFAGYIFLSVQFFFLATFTTKKKKEKGKRNVVIAAQIKMETWEILSFDFYYLEYDEPRKRPDWYVDECPLQRLEAFAVGRQRRPRRATKPLTIPSTVQVTIWKLPLFLLFLNWTAMGFETKQQQKRRCRSKRLPAVRVFWLFLIELLIKDGEGDTPGNIRDEWDTR